MAKDLLGGLGGLMKGLSGLMPQDDPDVKVMNAQTQVSELQQQELDLYAQIGKRALEKDGLQAYGELGQRLALVQSNLSEAKAALQTAQEEKQQQEDQKRNALAQRTCPECGYENPEGVKFCQECGTKLGVPADSICPDCGASNPRGTKFCGECGRRL